MYFFKPIDYTGSIGTTKIFKIMEKFYKNEKFNYVVKAYMEFVNKKRRSEMGGVKKISIPKKVLKLKDCIDNDNKIDEYIADQNEYSDDDSMNSSASEYDEN
jgi:hypothetical protein